MEHPRALTPHRTAASIPSHEIPTSCLHKIPTLRGMKSPPLPSASSLTQSFLSVSTQAMNLRPFSRFGEL